MFLKNNWILLEFLKTFVKVNVRQVFVNVWRNFIFSGHHVRFEKLFAALDMARNRFVIFHFGLFLTLLPPSQPKKSKFGKNEKNT